MLSVIFVFIIFSLFIKMRSFDEKVRRRSYSRLVSFASFVSLKILGVSVNVKGIDSLEESQFLISNHMGVIDIMIIASLCPTLFITSIEMKQTPGLGFITEMAGCLYVERRSRQNIQNEIQEIRNALAQKLNITLYPEGMATNGEKIYPFKKSLLTAAAGTGVSLKPLVVNFTKVNGQNMNSYWRDFVCWYGDQSFLSAMLRTFSTFSIEAEVEFLDRVSIQSEDQRREVASILQSKIEEKFRPMIG